MDDRHPSDIPDPPPHVLDAIGEAWDRAAGVLADGLELHISAGTIGNRVRGRLCLEDQVLMRLGPSELVALACGDLGAFGAA